MREISVTELARKREAGDDVVILDVREAEEVRLAALEGALHIPMGEVYEHLAELPRDREIVVMCHHGGRSQRVTGFLNANGFPNAVNLAGGIDAWSVAVDDAVARY